MAIEDSLNKRFLSAPEKSTIKKEDGRGGECIVDQLNLLSLLPLFTIRVIMQRLEYSVHLTKHQLI